MVRHRSSFRIAAARFLIAFGLASALALSGGGAGAGDADDQDLRARKLFAAGDYRQALDIYVNLYAETLHPTYLRNIGRCQQNLGEADKAIASFREYLRKAKDLTAAQRQEIEGHIAEMEALKQKQAGGARPEPGAGAGARPAPEPPPSADLRAPPPTTGPTPGPAPAAVVSAPEAPAPAAGDEAPPFYARVWFWVAVGAVAAGAVGAFLLLRDDGGRGPLDTLDLRGGAAP